MKLDENQVANFVMSFTKGHLDRDTLALLLKNSFNAGANAVIDVALAEITLQRTDVEIKCKLLEIRTNLDV